MSNAKRQGLVTARLGLPQTENKRCACCEGSGFRYDGRSKVWNLYTCLQCQTVKIVKGAT